VHTGLSDPRFKIPTEGWFLGAMCVIRDRAEEDQAKTLQERASELKTLYLARGICRWNDDWVVWD
jgi:hypothetical protein